MEQILTRTKTDTTVKLPYVLYVLKVELYQEELVIKKYNQTYFGTIFSDF